MGFGAQGLDYSVRKFRNEVNRANLMTMILAVASLAIAIVALVRTF